MTPQQRAKLREASQRARDAFLVAIDQCPTLRWRIINEFSPKEGA